MKKMTVGACKAHCLAVIDQVQARREGVLITKHGRTIAKLVSSGSEPDDIFNFLAGKGSINGDLVAPAMSVDEWGELG